jgi:hypothetical protein
MPKNETKGTINNLCAIYVKKCGAKGAWGGGESRGVGLFSGQKRRNILD